MNHQEIKELHPVGEFLECLVRESVSPFAVLAFLVLKKDGSWRMFFDSRAMNKITIKIQFSIMHQDDLFDQLHGSRVFSNV